MIDIQVKETVVDDSLRETRMHGTSDFPFAVYFDDFSDYENGFISWHWHEEVQLTMILEGSFLCSVENDEYAINPGDIVFINRGLLHQINPLKKFSGKLYSFIFKPEILSSPQSRAFKEVISPVLERGNRNYVFLNDHKLQSYLLNIVSKVLQDKTYNPLEIVNELSTIWLYLSSKLEYTSVFKNSKDDERVRSALNFIQENYSKNISLEDIAQAIFISRSELCRCFKKVLSTSPKEFLMQYRIKQATILLENPNYTITQISEMIGFSSPSHFGSAFLKYVGCTPKKYKKRQIVN